MAPMTIVDTVLQQMANTGVSYTPMPPAVVVSNAGEREACDLRILITSLCK